MNITEIIYPIITAKRINAQIKKEKKETFSEFKTQWDKLLEKITKEEQFSQFEKITNDIYTSHERGIRALETKAESLLAGVSISISLLSVIVAFSADGIDFLSLQFVAFCFFTFSTSEMIVAAIAAGLVVRVSDRNISNLLDLKKFLIGGKDIKDWISTQIANVEVNNMTWTIKGNWLDAAQTHFRRGIISTGIGFVLLLLYILNGSGIENLIIQLKESLFINDLVSITK